MKPFYTHREELWNSWSHAAGILLGMAFGMVFLYWCFRVKDGWATFGVSLYLLGMVGSYVASTSYHALRPASPWKERLRKWDHAAIYWHIAGSYSPITLVALRGEGPWGWLLFAFVWTCAIGGTISSLRKLKPHSNIETLTYVGMGLSVLVAFKPLLHAVEVSSVAWIIAEGVMSRVRSSIPSTAAAIPTPFSISSSLREVSAISWPSGASCSSISKQAGGGIPTGSLSSKQR